jgi:hypothetical protein
MKNSLQCFINDVTSWASKHPFTATLTACFLAVGSVPIIASTIFIIVSAAVGIVSWIACQVVVIVATLVCLSFFLCFALCCSGCATSLVVTAYYSLKLLGTGLEAACPSKKTQKESEDTDEFADPQE